jgi:DNA-binding SARP family transcriptional activator/tetratricopeptide (TPR) repeat protein
MASPAADRPTAPGRPGSTGAQPAAGVEIRLVGSFAVRRHGLELAASELGSRKARQLLKLVTVRRGHLVPVDEIVEVLWGGDQPPSQAPENVATLVSRLRNILGAEVVLGGRGGYELGPAGQVQVDLDVAARWVGEAEARVAEGEPGLGMVSARRAIELIAAGSVLDDEPSAEWAEPARLLLAAVQRGARLALALAAIEAGDPSAALPVAVAAHGADPFDETACRLLMRAYAGVGEPARAVAAYADLRDLLATELGADPAAETQALHLSLLREEDVSAARPALARGTESAGLVGRSGEMQALRTAWNAAAAGTGSFVLVSGEAGIGKTRLCDELAAVAESTGGTVLRTRCYETERSLFLQPVVDAIATAFRTLPPDRTREAAGEWAGLLANLVPTAVPVLGPAAAHGRGSVEVERRRAFEAVTAFVRRLSAHSPVLLVIDDLHVAGRASVELLHYLARHTATSRVMTVGTIRSDEGADALQALADVASPVDLGVLSADAVSRLAAAAGQAELAESVQQRTGGHALFVVESLRALAAGEAGLPRSLQDAVVSRVARTGPGVEALLRAGSVLGASFPPAIAARLLGEPLPVVLSRGEDALAARLLVASGRDYEFSNDLIREVLYATTPAPTRLAHHARAADLLTDRPEAVAVHAVACEDWLRAARALLLAGEQALDRFAADDAEELLGRCLDLSDRASDVELRARGLLARARARTARAAYGAAVEDLDEAVRLARLVGDRRLEMLALRALGGEAPTLLGVGLAETTGHLRLGLKIATALGDRAMESDLLGWLAVLACNALRFDEGVDYGLRAVAAARASGSDEALAAALDGRKTALAYLGEIDHLVPVLAELEPLAYRLDHPQRLHWMIFESGFPALAAGDWATATMWFERALEACRRSGQVGYEAWHLAHLGLLARLQGDAATALELGRQAVELNQEIPNAWCGAAASALLGTTLLELGDVEAAVAVLAAGCELAAPEGSQSYLLRCLAPLAEADGERATLERADALLASVQTPPGAAWMGGDFAYLSVARAWLAAGDPRRARQVLAPMLAAARRVPWVAPLAHGSLLDGRAAARLAEPELARARFEQAAQVAARHGLVRLAAEARAELD